MYKYDISAIENYCWNLNFNRFIKEDNFQELYNTLDVGDLADIVIDNFINTRENDISDKDLDKIYNQLITDTDFIAIVEMISEEIDDMIYDLEETQYRRIRERF
jgi:hypothetical protein